MRESENEHQKPIFLKIIFSFWILVSITCKHFLGVYTPHHCVSTCNIIKKKFKKPIISGQDISWQFQESLKTKSLLGLNVALALPQTHPRPVVFEIPIDQIPLYPSLRLA